ncbi:MAG TPA: YceI family protein [Flavobacterium sp.]|jgi:polyisoprenoid-binding protein YceI
MKTIATALIVLLVTPAVKPPTKQWQLDKSHSSISFAVDHLLVSETIGKFEDYSLEVKSDKEDFTDASFSFTAKVNSINTNEPKRDEHLKQEDFFDAAKYPLITFKSTSFRKLKAGGYKIKGELTIKNVTKTVEFNAKFGGIVKDPWGGTRSGLKIWGAINRFDYGLQYNSILDSGGLAVGEEVRFTCNIELIQKK